MENNKSDDHISFYLTPNDVISIVGYETRNKIMNLRRIFLKTFPHFHCTGLKFLDDMILSFLVRNDNKLQYLFIKGKGNQGESYQRSTDYATQVLMNLQPLVLYNDATKCGTKFFTDNHNVVDNDINIDNHNHNVVDNHNHHNHHVVDNHNNNNHHVVDNHNVAELVHDSMHKIRLVKTNKFKHYVCQMINLN